MSVIKIKQITVLFTPCIIVNNDNKDADGNDVDPRKKYEAGHIKPESITTVDIINASFRWLIKSICVSLIILICSTYLSFYDL